MDHEESIELSHEQQQCFERIESGNGHFFVTGNAGTGKSLLLRYLKDHSKKRMIVSAFTGVAALNVGAQTINSLFQLPIGFIDLHKLKSERRTASLLKYLDMVVIDEISMVRADMMDAIDLLLRRARENDAPFGGVQMVMFGDLYQLSPIVGDTQLQKYFTDYHGGPYFFNAHVWQRAPMEIVELRENHRQREDSDFLAMLNAIRAGRLDDDILDRLNTRVAEEMPDERTITLASTNAIVDRMNGYRLDQIDDQSYRYKAEISGDLEPSAFPADETLSLKRGAQVMLLKNDPQRRWVNGSIGIVESLAEHQIDVDLDGTVHSIPRQTWDKIRYRYDIMTGKVEQEVVSSFTQFPLRLAWAITIHKSQGKTYQSVAIDMGNRAFAHGQTYVALSRCTSLDGVYLRRPITRSDIIVDPIVVKFMQHAQSAASYLAPQRYSLLK